MSNPGVLTLTQKLISGNKAFRVEDNLGESIHFHYNDIRIDLTIRELLDIADVCDYTIYDMIPVKGFNLDEYQEDFLNSCSDKLIDLIAVERASVKANQLYYIKRNRFGIPIKRPVIQYSCDSLADYTDDRFLPVVYNNDDILQYGIEQVSRALSIDSNSTVSVIRLQFEGGKHSESKHPIIDYFFKWNKERFKKTMKKFAKKIFK